MYARSFGCCWLGVESPEPTPDSQVPGPKEVVGLFVCPSDHPLRPEVRSMRFDGPTGDSGGPAPHQRVRPTDMWANPLTLVAGAGFGRIALSCNKSERAPDQHRPSLAVSGRLPGKCCSGARPGQCADLVVGFSTGRTALVDEDGDRIRAVIRQFGARRRTTAAGVG